MGGRLDSEKEMAVEATQDDIKLYVEARITEDTDLSRLTWEGLDDDPAFMENICNVVIEKAQGMFLLAKMHMDYLAEQHFLGDFRVALGKLPDSREKAFDAALQRIQRQGDFERRVAWHVLSWVAFSVQPVTVDEVRHAFAVERQAGVLNDEYLPSKDLLTSSCAGVVVIDKESGQLRPIHDAVLKRIRESEHLPDDPNRDIATACLAYLSLSNFALSSPSESDISELVQKYPLLRYASKHWLLHLNRVKNADQALETQTLDFLENKACLSVSFRVHNPSSTNEISGLHACAYLGAESLAHSLLERKADLDARTETEQTPLHWTITYRKHEMAKLFLEKGAQANARDGHGNSPLHTLVCSLCDVKDVEGQAVQTDLSSNVRNLIILLVQNGADIDLEDRKGWTSLRRAIVYGKLGLAELLLDHGSDVNRRFEDGWTALGHAAQHGMKPLVLLLLQYKANVDLREGDQGPSPLMKAIRQEHRSVAGLLLDHGADANAIFANKSTPLIRASREAQEWAVWLLLRHGALVDSHDANGLTALSYAVNSGQKSIAWLLCEEGASLGLRDKIDGSTALHYAAERGDVSTAWYLLGKGVLVDAAGFDGIQPLHIAAKHGHAKLIDLFIDHGDDIINQQDKSGLTALHYAVRSKHLECVSLLLEKGADPNAVDGKKATPLHFAAWCEDEEFSQLLLNAKADATIQDDEGRTALHRAVVQGNMSTTWRLAKVKECLDVRDKDGQTALIYAAEKGDELATLCLVNNGANTGIQDAKNWIAQDYAVDKQYSLIVSLLH
ncbi:ankyrin repeat protein [Colletotrichum plurivorum]|uniref:Ankyrin repeat protein n=1 Tax=Colletotrichum plurivorum TaxID=2175906 RepID=A0A8H6NEK1_9PEZI|nr:ankyrin repeat protein [Colletotrichum plurivorum]